MPSFRVTKVPTIKRAGGNFHIAAGNPDGLDVVMPVDVARGFSDALQAAVYPENLSDLARLRLVVIGGAAPVFEKPFTESESEVATGQHD